MKVLLAFPQCLEPRPPEDVAAVPMGLYTIGALLKENGHQVDIVNLQGLEDASSRFRALLREASPDLVGFSVLNANRWGAVAAARLAREWSPSVKIVLGGVAATFLWDHFLRHFPQVDCVVLGEGEFSFLNLVEALEKGGRERLEGIRGIAWRKEGRPFRTEPAKRIEDLDVLPIPARYFTYRHVSLSRGCPGRCSFCGSPRFWGPKVRFHSPGYFVDQLELLYRKGVTFFYFSDDMFTLKKDLALEVCREIVRRGLDIAWYAISRVDCVDEELLCWMRRAGCIQISYGVESGSPRIRKALNKAIAREQIVDAFSLTTRYGILARAYFIYGCPGETDETVEETIRLIKEIRPLNVLFYALQVFPGTDLYEELAARLHLTDDVWLEPVEDILYSQTDPALPAEKMLEFRKKLRETFHGELPRFAESLQVADLPELYPLHSDFFSRLGMTFSHGDFARVEGIPRRDRTAAMLYRRALSYAPDPRAFLGLGILEQKAGNYRESAEVLAEGVEHFPENEPLHVCLAVSLMNLGDYQEALETLLKVRHSPEAQPHLAACRQALGLDPKEAGESR